MFARKSFLIVLSNFLSHFIGWIGLVFLIRTWGYFAPDALGIIGYTLSFLAMFNIIADLGFTQAHIKRISEGKDLGTCIGTFILIKLILLSIMLIVIFAYLFIWLNVLRQDLSNSTSLSIILVFTLYYVFLNLTKIATVTFEGRQEIAKRQTVHLFEVVKTPLMILVAIAGIGIAGKASSIVLPDFLKPLEAFITKNALSSLAMTYTFSAIATFIVGFWFLRKYPIKKPSKDYLRSYFVFAMPMMLFSVISIVAVNIDKLMIGFFWSETEVGYYFSIQQILLMVTVLYVAVGTILFPTISAYYSKKDIGNINKTILLAERYLSMIMIPPIVVIIVLVNPVISIILSTAFLPAASVLIILSIYTFFFSLNRPYFNLLIGMNKPGLSMRISLVISFINIFLNFLFIPKNGILAPIGINGINGAALAAVLSNATGFFGFRYYAKKLSGINFLQTHTFKHIFAGFVMGLVLYFIAIRSNLFPNVYWYFLLMFAVIGLAVYIGVLFLLKEFDKNDFYFFLDIIHPNKMLKYVTVELKDKPNNNK